jgi:hypothetical protein
VDSYRKTAAVVGALFLIAMVASLLGGALVESGLVVSAGGSSAVSSPTPVHVGVVLELVNALAVVGIAVALFPVFRRHSEGMALGYVGMRILEAVFLTAAAFLPLSVVALSRDRGAADPASLEALGRQLLSMRAGMTGALVPLFFALGALLLYSWMVRTRIVPRFLAVWGLLGVGLIVALNLLPVGMGVGLVLALPMILNEIVLGIWLLARGFDVSAIAGSRAATTSLP